MHQVGSFKMTGSGQVRQVRSSVVPAAQTFRQTSAGPTKKPVFRHPAALHSTVPEPVGVAAGNGKDRRQSDTEFEEF
jgi:hypothetical protein